jgi:hypothetical protein
MKFITKTTKIQIVPILMRVDVDDRGIVSITIAGRFSNVIGDARW